jgi:hypothetical protein
MALLVRTHDVFLADRWAYIGGVSCATSPPAAGPTTLRTSTTEFQSTDVFPVLAVHREEESPLRTFPQCYIAEAGRLIKVQSDRHKLYWTTGCAKGMYQ